jgi:hypothetical protein
MQYLLPEYHHMYRACREDVLGRWHLHPEGTQGAERADFCLSNSSTEICNWHIKTAYLQIVQCGELQQLRP